MDHGASSEPYSHICANYKPYLTTFLGHSVIERLLNTNRPPTDEERAIVQESLSPTEAELKAIESQISYAEAHIQALKLQIEETESKLQRLRQEKTALWEASADHRRVLSSFKNLPEDVIREILIEYVDLGEYVPSLFYGGTSVPYQLAQISSGLRFIALTTPAIWATMGVYVNRYYYDDIERTTPVYLALAAKAIEWLDRAGGHDLYIVIQDATPSYERPEDMLSDPSMILFDTILRYSTRFQTLQFYSKCLQDEPSPPIVPIAALTALEVPKLTKLVLQIESGISAFLHSPIFSVPKLRRMTLDTEWPEFAPHPALSQFPVNWASLTSLTIGGGNSDLDRVSSLGEIMEVLRQTKYLVYCDITVRPAWEHEHTLPKVNLPHLETLFVDDRTASTVRCNIFDLIDVPMLCSLKRCARYISRSLVNFFKRSPTIQVLYLKTVLESQESLAEVTELLRHCPSLYFLTLKAQDSGTRKKNPDANVFLRSFIEGGGASGITCPLLQRFRFIGSIKFSFQTLSCFLEAKQPDTAVSDPLVPWQSIELSMQGVDDLEIYQMMALVSQKQAAGLDIRVHAKISLPFSR